MGVRGCSCAKLAQWGHLTQALFTIEVFALGGHFANASTIIGTNTVYNVPRTIGNDAVVAIRIDLDGAASPVAQNMALTTALFVGQGRLS
jgi:hypothetical protein